MEPVHAAVPLTVTFAGSGDAFGSGGRCQACIHLDGGGLAAPVLLDCGATSLTALQRCVLDLARWPPCSCPSCTGTTSAGCRS
jgi:hypothetical protein